MTTGLTNLHPSVPTSASIPAPRRRWLTRLALPGAILLAMVLLLGYAARETLLPAQAVSVIRVVGKPVEVTASAAGDASASGGGRGAVVAQAPGWLEPDPYPIYVSALTDGVVEQVHVLEGETVKQGQVVATMVDDDARLAVQQAEAERGRRIAELNMAQAALTAAETDWENPVELDRAVAVAESKLAESKAQIDQLASVVVEEQAKANELKQQYERLAKLLPNATSELEVEQARYRFEAQQALVASTQKQRDVLAAQLAAMQADVTAAKDNRRLRVDQKLMLDSAAAKVAEARAMVNEAQAALADAKLRLERMQVRATADGVVMARIASPGDKLMFGGDMQHSAHVVHLYDPRKLQVRVDVPLADAAKVGFKQPATVVVDVLPEREFRGELTRIVHKASIEKNTLEVKVAIIDPLPQLKPDMLARVKFHAPRNAPDEPADGAPARAATELRVFVPERLLADRHQNHAHIWTIDPADSTARRPQVTVGTHRENGWIEIVSGLNPGDVVIADPAGLDEGDRVTIREEQSN